MTLCGDYRSKVVRKWNGTEIETISPKSGEGIYLFFNGIFEAFIDTNDHEKAHRIAELRIVGGDN